VGSCENKGVMLKYLYQYTVSDPYRFSFPICQKGRFPKLPRDVKGQAKHKCLVATIPTQTQQA